MLNSSSWHPVLPAQQLRAGENIVAGFLQGQELALWRSVDGVAQAWENRCPHRGTRLTLGRILDGRLSCAYHGWEFEAGTGQCAVIPAQPQAPVPRGVCVKTWQVAEAGGMVWVSTRPLEPSKPVAAEASSLGFARSLALRVDVALAVRRLQAQGFLQAGSFVWQGRLAERELTVYLTEAQADWVFLHLFAQAGIDEPGLRAIMAAARRLRTSIEEGEGA